MTSADVLPSPRALPRPAVFGLGALVAVWAATIAGGWWLMTSYAFKTNPPRAAPPRAWPVESMLPRLPGQEAVLVFLHPRCPCSRATIGELERVLALPSDAAKPQVFVVATVPGSRAEWGEAPLVRRAAELPGAKLWIDAGGAEAARFGAVTSGTVLAFDAAGRRRYAGGVTIARGHDGPSVGGATLAAVLSGQPTSEVAPPPFGCRLVLPPATPATDDPRALAEITTP